MCGISGFNWKDEQKIAAMVSVLAHRGPDAQGTYVNDCVSLGHDRLSVIDLAARSNQPLHDEKDELVITFNGEIYNFRELRAELESSYVFKTSSDTEVILAGYRKWGEGVVEHLNGMFAFAIWDKRTKTLFCARDHAGMKPFYYYWDPSNTSRSSPSDARPSESRTGQAGRFIFASEIPAILTHDVPRTLNREAFNHYLRVLFTPEPLTLIQNIFKLPASHTLTLKGGTLSVQPYAAAPAPASPHSYQEAAALLKETVAQAVKRHLVSDVPVGVYLSGGIDSSIMLAAARPHVSDLKSFTVGFDLTEGQEPEKFNEDFELAARTALHFGTEHHPVRLSTHEALSLMEEVAAHNSDPISNPTSLAMYLLAKKTKPMVSVVLTGNGGDELFGGYDRYRMALAADYYRKLPAFLRALCDIHPRLRKLDQSTEELFAQFMFQKDERLSPVLASGVLGPAGDTLSRYRPYLEGDDSAEALMRADRLSWLPEHFFMLTDHMSMSSALEERMPLLDLEVKALAASFPRSYKVDLFNTKKILKDAFRKELPEYLFEQPKRGWFSPAAKWLRDPAFGRFAKEILSEHYYAGTEALFNWPAVADMLERHISKDRYNLVALLAILTFQLWAQHHRITL